MKRTSDLLLVVIALLGVIYGGVHFGHAIARESQAAATWASQPQPAAGAAAPHVTSAPITHARFEKPRIEMISALAVLALAAMMALLALADSLKRSRRRQRWRLQL